MTAPVLVAASLELKAEKKSAHSKWVYSVAFSPDGKTIVSGSKDKTIKVSDFERLVDSTRDDGRAVGRELHGLD